LEILFSGGNLLSTPDSRVVEMAGLRRRLVAMAFLATSFGFVPSLTVRGEASPVSVLYTGDPYPGQTAYVYMKVEPLLSVTPIQASRDHYAGISQKDILRAIRMYMPRSYHDLTDSYDVVVISDSNVASFTKEHLKWFKQAVEQGMVGLVMVGGHETFGTNGQHPSWGPTPVGDVLPVDTVYGAFEAGVVSIDDADNPFMKSLPWRPGLPFLKRYEGNVLSARLGAQVLATSMVTRKLVYNKRYLGWKSPFFSTWDYNGNGRVFAMAGDWTPAGGWIFMQWEYYPDFVTNLMLYCAKRELPEDLDLVHTVRERMTTLGYRRMILYAMVDFVEKLGANPRRILIAMEQVDHAGGKAKELYLEGDFASALLETDRVFSLLERAEAVSERVKRDALLWIYLVEWLAVTGTFLICGLVIWSLMVRRRMYREVSTTSSVHST